MENPLEAALAGRPPPDQTQPPPTPQPPPPLEAPEGPPRGPDGRFLALESEGNTPEVAPEPPVQPPPDPGPTPGGHVPISAMLDEREKRQVAERALKAFQQRVERERDAWRAQNPPTPEEQRVAERHADNLRISRKFAAREYGDTFVQQVHDWAFARCETDPRFNQQMRASDDPYEDAVQAYRREEVLQAVSPADLEAFNAWKSAQAQIQAQQPETPASAAPPPRSLANAPGNGAAGKTFIPEAPGEAFRSAIGR